MSKLNPFALLCILLMQSAAITSAELTDSSSEAEPKFTDSNAYYFSIGGILAGWLTGVFLCPVGGQLVQPIEERLLWIIFISISVGSIGYIIGEKLDEFPE